MQRTRSKYRRKRWTFEAAAEFARKQIDQRGTYALAGATRLLAWAATRYARGLKGTAK